jgi:hypothetical protein
MNRRGAAHGGHSVMPERHGFQIQEVVARSSPEFLITGARSGIGRATLLAFASEGSSVVLSGRREEEGKKSFWLNSANWAQKRISSVPTLVTKKICGA